MFKENNRYLINTPTGFRHFKGIQKKIVDSLYTFKMVDGKEIKCSGKHLFLTNNGLQKAKNITLLDTLSGLAINSINIEYGTFEVYDPVEVEEHNTYFSNDIISHNTEFIGSSSTLINANKLMNLVSERPISFNHEFAKWEEPIQNHTYAMCCDVARGVGGDSSTFTVIDVTDIPYRVVARYKNNTVSPLIFPSIIHSVATHYNEAFVLIEINDNGQQVADILHLELEYENIFMSQLKGSKGQTITGGFGRSIPGLRTTLQTKTIGCANLKTLIEDDKLLLRDVEIIQELYQFVETNKTYAAEEGAHDDLVMSLVLFAWLTHQSFFKEWSDGDVRRRILQEKQQMLEDDMLPFGIIPHAEEYDPDTIIDMSASDFERFLRS